MTIAVNPVKTPSSGVQSVERAFELLELVMESGGEAALGALSASTGLPRPTIHRLLRTLVAIGYARQLRNRRYVLGPRLIRMGEEAARQFGVVARPQLEQLVSSLGESANLAVLDGDRVVYVAQVPSRHSMRIFTEVGRRADVHDTGVGKAILAQLPDEAVRGIVARTGMPTQTEHSIGTVDDLLAELERIRERGFSIDEQEHEIGVRCFAMAVPDAPTLTAVSVSGPISRLDEEFASRAVPLLRTAAMAISADQVA